MRKIIAVLMAVLSGVLCFAGCGAEEVRLPKGVCEYGDKTYYRVMLPSAKKVGDCFSLTGNKNTMVVSFFGEKGVDQGDEAVYFQNVTQGGWVAYSKGETGLVLYFSSQFDVEEVQLACTALTRAKENYMSWDAAKEYISWLH